MTDRDYKRLRSAFVID